MFLTHRHRAALLQQRALRKVPVPRPKNPGAEQPLPCPQQSRHGDSSVPVPHTVRNPTDPLLPLLPGGETPALSRSLSANKRVSNQVAQKAAPVLCHTHVPPQQKAVVTATRRDEAGSATALSPKPPTPRAHALWEGQGDAPDSTGEVAFLSPRAKSGGAAFPGQRTQRMEGTPRIASASHCGLIFMSAHVKGFYKQYQTL